MDGGEKSILKIEESLVRASRSSVRTRGDRRERERERHDGQSSFIIFIAQLRSCNEIFARNLHRKLEAKEWGKRKEREKIYFHARIEQKFPKCHRFTVRLLTEEESFQRREKSKFESFPPTFQNFS